MYEIKNYIKKPHIIIDVAIDDQNVNNFFVDLTDREEIFKIKETLDPFYLEGAIALKWNDCPLFRVSQWDMLDQLWAYILNLFEEYLTEGRSSVFFPDQPIEIKMKKDNRKILLSIEDRTFLVSEVEFIHCMLNEAEVFFKTIEEYRLGNYSNELAQVERIRQRMLHNKIT
jgi:hypothetical protein